MSIEVKEIVIKYLKDHKFDGLFSSGCECACELEDLFPCCEYGLISCKPGYKMPCDCGDHNFHIGLTV